MVIYDAWSRLPPPPKENPIKDLVAKGYENWGYHNDCFTWPQERLKEFESCVKNGLTRKITMSANGSLFLIVCDEKKWFCSVDCSD